MSSYSFRFEPLPHRPELDALRAQVRGFLAEQEASKAFTPGPQGWAGFDPVFSRALAQRGWIGMTWPSRYGGQGRSAMERLVVTEELLAASAPVRAHWVADRQSGPLLLRFGTEQQRQEYLPRIARGECYFCIGMSEADSGSDLASIRTKAEKVDGGWRINGAKLWTSNAHRVHMMILFARTSAATQDRREGVSQFLVDLQSKGITIRPIRNLAGEHDFNEVLLQDVFVPDEMVIGTIGGGWKQVTSELVYERSGPDRWLSSYYLLRRLADQAGQGKDDAVGTAMVRQAAGRLAAHLWTLRQMAGSIAGQVEAGQLPNTEAAMVKDLGTAFEREIPEIVRAVVPERVRFGDPGLRCAELAHALDHVALHAPSFTIRGGTREILRGIIAKSLGMR